MWPYPYFSSFIEEGGLVLFRADDGLHGMELWATDGTSTTRMVQDIAQGAGWSSPGSFTRVGDLLYFTADDHISGRELWAIPISNLQQVFNLAATRADVATPDKPSRGTPDLKARRADATTADGRIIEIK
jgi:ELWxxDGT repeat protein